MADPLDAIIDRCRESAPPKSEAALSVGATDGEDQVSLRYAYETSLGVATSQSPPTCDKTLNGCMKWHGDMLRHGGHQVPGTGLWSPCPFELGDERCGATWHAGCGRSLSGGTVNCRCDLGQPARGYLIGGFLDPVGPVRP